jgi:hypothetical protein
MAATERSPDMKTKQLRLSIHTEAVPLIDHIRARLAGLHERQRLREERRKAQNARKASSKPQSAIQDVIEDCL